MLLRGQNHTRLYEILVFIFALPKFKFATFSPQSTAALNQYFIPTCALLKFHYLKKLSLKIIPSFKINWPSDLLNKSLYVTFRKK